MHESRVTASKSWAKRAESEKRAGPPSLAAGEHLRSAFTQVKQCSAQNIYQLKNKYSPKKPNHVNKIHFT